jgi:hypothetical protein
MLRALNVVAPPVLIEDHCLTPGNKIDYVLAHTGFMGSHKLSIFDGR